MPETSRSFDLTPHAPRSAAADRPRERLRSLGAAALAEAELLALVLRTGTRTGSAEEVARGLLERFGGLRGVATATAEELARARGLGPAKAASLIGALELGRRAATRALERGAVLRGPEDVYAHFGPRLRELAQERFLVLLLDGRHRVVGEATVSQGTLTASLVHPREVFRPALQAAAAAVVLVHNHPSGDPQPSAEDRQVTERLERAGELIGIRVVDHIVVADSGFYSFREAGGLRDTGS